MGYSQPIGGVSRTLTSNIFIHSAPFTRFNFLQFGARMSVLKLSPESYAIYAAIPYEEAMIKSITNEIKDDDWLSKVTHVIVPDTEHTMGVLSYKGKLSPDVQIIGMETVNPKVNEVIQVKLDDSVSNRVLEQDDLIKLGITDPLFNSTLKLVYVPGHSNKELVVFDTVSKTLLTADLFFNLKTTNEDNDPHHNEQFGYKNPHSGFSSITGYVNPLSSVGRFMLKGVLGGNKPAQKQLIQEIYNLKFEKMIMCHGDVINSNAYEVFKQGFLSFFT